MNDLDSARLIHAFSESAGGELSQMLLLMAGMGAIIYFMMIRPGQKERKEQEAFLTALTKGDKVVTSSGVHGKIIEVDQATVRIEVASKTVITLEKSSIARRAAKDVAQAAGK
jgi:preprotein translocase subunit YajC